MTLTIRALQSLPSKGISPIITACAGFIMMIATIAWVAFILIPLGLALGAMLVSLAASAFN